MNTSKTLDEYVDDAFMRARDVVLADYTHAAILRKWNAVMQPQVELTTLESWLQGNADHVFKSWICGIAAQKL